MRTIASGIVEMELRALGEEALPAFKAGAHIELHLPNGMSRKYSLVNSQDDADRYQLAVKREQPGRGGSAYIHEALRPGDCVVISPPHNQFSLDETADHSVFFAGGIGVTPIVSMVRRLASIGRTFDVYYGARLRAEAAFADMLTNLSDACDGRIELRLDDERDGCRIDFRLAAEASPANSHFYCCGPAPMIDAYERALSHIPAHRVHRERFSGGAERGCQGGFEVVLAKSRRTVHIPDGETILDTLLNEGVEVDFSCMEGFCGSCRVGVVKGIPIHKDTVLNASERASNKVMMICCSSALGERLVLDL